MDKIGETPEAYTFKDLQVFLEWCAEVSDLEFREIPKEIKDNVVNVDFFNRKIIS
jgi:uncharacterized protein YfaQ (DUF2300 family)